MRTGHHAAALDAMAAAVRLADAGIRDWERARLGEDPECCELSTIASGGDEVLVIGRRHRTDRPAGPWPEPATIDRYLVWIVDAGTGRTRRSSLPVAAPVPGDDVSAHAARFDRRWIVALERLVWTGTRGWEPRTALLESEDGLAWIVSNAPEEWAGGLAGMAAGSPGIVATVCHFGGDSFWYSPDGRTWTRTGSGLGHDVAHVEGLGFVVAHGDSWSVSDDGTAWRDPSGLTVTVGPYAGDATVADGGLFVLGDRLWSWSSRQS